MGADEVRIKSCFQYDPTRDSFDSARWKTVSGTPAIAGGVLVLNNAEVLEKRDIEYIGSLIMNIKVPADPIAGDSRFFGLKSLSMGGYIGFDITGAVFSLVCDNGLAGANHLSDSAVATWDSDWATADTEFRIDWLQGRANFYVNNVFVGFLDATKCPKVTTSLNIKNTNADALSVKYVSYKNVADHSDGITANVNVTADTEFPVASALADNEANPTTTRVGANMLGWDGSNWDRIKAGISSVTSSMTGWLNTMPWAIFHTTPTTRTTGQGGPLEADAKGNLKTLNMASLIPVEFDTVEEDYSGATADVYTYKKATVTVATITRNWTDATKTVGLSVVRT
jgi:hypothetical protein